METPKLEKFTILLVNLDNFLLHSNGGENSLCVHAIGSKHQKKIWMNVGWPQALIPAEFADFKIEYVDGHFGLSFWNNRKGVEQTVPFLTNEGTVPTLI